MGKIAEAHRKYFSNIKNSFHKRPLTPLTHFDKFVTTPAALTTGVVGGSMAAVGGVAVGLPSIGFGFLLSKKLFKFGMKATILAPIAGGLLITASVLDILKAPYNGIQALRHRHRDSNKQFDDRALDIFYPILIPNSSRSATYCIIEEPDSDIPLTPTDSSTIDPTELPFTVEDLDNSCPQTPSSTPAVNRHGNSYTILVAQLDVSSTNIETSTASSPLAANDDLEPKVHPSPLATNSVLQYRVEEPAERQLQTNFTM